MGDRAAKLLFEAEYADLSIEEAWTQVEKLRHWSSFDSDAAIRQREETYRQQARQSGDDSGVTSAVRRIPDDNSGVEPDQH